VGGARGTRRGGGGGARPVTARSGSTGGPARARGGWGRPGCRGAA
jgi:hypothetical protein